MLRAIDQVLFQIHYQFFQRRRNRELKRRAFAERFGTEAFKLPRRMPVHPFADLNSEEAKDTLTWLKPDLVFAVCISQYLHASYQEIPRFGTALYHEGLTPEYKGLQTAFWANHEGEPHRIGYTLLQINAGIDAGRPLAQGVGAIDPGLARWWNYAGHKALIDGLPDVHRALARIEADEPPGVEPREGAGRMWTYPGLSDELRRAWRSRRSRRLVRPKSHA
jgi:hypothetical protein